MKGNQQGTESFLRSVTLPEKTKTYTPITHGEIMDKIEAELSNAGFVVIDRKYTYCYAGEVAKGELYIESDIDPDMGMLFTWQNSYNKMVKFSCGIGGYIYDNKTTFFGTEGLSWIRKHTGKADEEAYSIIEQIVDCANEHFEKIIQDKNKMKAQSMNIEMFARLMGALYFEHNLVTSTQAEAVRKEYTKPAHVYSDFDTLWGLYKILMFGIDNMIITKWQDSQQKLHHTILNEYDFSSFNNETETVDLIDEPINLVDKPDPDFTISHNSLVGIGDLNEPELTETEIDSEITAIEEGLDHKGDIKPIVLAEDLVKPEFETTLEIEEEPRMEMVNPKSTEELVHEYNAAHDDSQMEAKTMPIEEAKEQYPEHEEAIDELAKIAEESDASTEELQIELEEKIEMEVQPVVGLDEPVEIISPDEVPASVEKVDDTPEEEVEEFEFPTDLDKFAEQPESQPEVEEIDFPVDAIPSVETKNEEPPEINLPEKEEPKKKEGIITATKDSFLDIEEHEGLTIPANVISQAACIEKEMAILFGEIKPYQVVETPTQVNIILDETGECFYMEPNACEE